VDRNLITIKPHALHVQKIANIAPIMAPVQTANLGIILQIQAFVNPVIIIVLSANLVQENVTGVILDISWMTWNTVLFAILITVALAQTPQYVILATMAILLMSKELVHHVLVIAAIVTILNNVSTAILVHF